MIRCLFMLSLAICLFGCATGNKRVDLPTQSTTHAEVIKQDNIRINAKGGITLNGTKVEMGNLTKQLKSSKVLIEADSSTPFKRVVSVMEKIKESGIKDISLATRNK